MNNKKNDNSGLGLWILAVILFASGAWFLAIPLILYKLGVFQSIKEKVNTNGAGTTRDAGMESRYARYMVYTDNADCVSLRFLSTALDIPYSTVVKDISRMVNTGRFSKDAYVDYARGMLVLRRTGEAADWQGQWKASSAEAETEATREAPGTAEAEAAPAASGAAKPAAGTVQPTTSPATSHVKPSIAPEVKPLAAEEPTAYSKALATLLLIGGIILITVGGIGAVSWLGELGSSFYGVGEVLWKAISFIFTALGGVSPLLVRAGLKRRGRRYKKYKNMANGRTAIDLTELVSGAGVPAATVIKDVEDMIERGWFGKGAYLDAGRMRLVLDPAAVKQEEPTQEEQEEAMDPKDRYAAILREIRQLDDDIADEEVSERIRQIEDLTRRIFREVQEKPDKLPQIKSFMSYYLPTTLKLLRSYAVMERQGVGGSNISSTKDRISSILDSLVDGFSQQLDQLFKSEAMDISTDIDVLESMMAKDGFIKDDSGFQAATRAGGSPFSASSPRTGSSASASAAAFQKE